MSPWKPFLWGLAICLGLSAISESARATTDETQARPPICEADVELVAVVYAENDRASSFAMVGAKGPRIVRIGSWVEDRQVIGMGPRSLVLGPVEEPCVARLTDRSTTRPSRARRRRGRSKRR